MKQKKNRLKEYFKARFGSLLDHLDEFSYSRDPEELHQLRVEIKKIKALHFLLKKCSAHSARNMDLDSIKEISRKAGGIRNIHNTIALADKFKLSDKTFRIKQGKLANEYTSQFLSRTKTFKISASRVCIAAEKKICGLPGKKIIHLYKKEIGSISVMFLQINDPDQLHECRKKIKNLVYIYDMLSKRLKKEIVINKKYLRRTETAIGDWHDSIAAIELLMGSHSGSKKLLITLKKRKEELERSISILSASFEKKALR